MLVSVIVPVLVNYSANGRQTHQAVPLPRHAQPMQPSVPRQSNSSVKGSGTEVPAHAGRRLPARPYSPRPD